MDGNHPEGYPALARDHADRSAQISRRALLTICMCGTLGGSVSVLSGCAAQNTLARLPLPQLGMAPKSQSWGVATEVPAFENAVSTPINTVLLFTSLHSDYPSRIPDIARSGRVPVLTIEPYTSPQGFDYQSIVRGNWDSKIAMWARYWRGQGPVRFAHEMNGGWYPWGALLGARRYVELWWKVQDVWRSSEAAHGIRQSPWIWCPNRAGGGVGRFDPYYPGEDRVDYVGIDAYSYELNGWPSPRNLFDSDLRHLSEIARAPLTIGETAVGVGHPRRGAWIAELFELVSEQSNLTGFNWYERYVDSGHDYRLQGDIRATYAYKTGAEALKEDRRGGG